LINTSIAVCPFINENSECDTLLLFSDILFVGLGFLFIISPIFGYYSVTSSLTWTIPIIFNLFLPAIEILGKIIRSINIALRLSSNLTAGHLLMLLIATFGEFLLTSSLVSFKFIGLIIFNFSIVITILESSLICIQSYVWSILILYYLNQDE
jgi:F0F1-type ATP synthase membrane subunit a